MHNDCLFKCIVEAINYDEIPEGFKPAYQFKRRLKLGRDDKVPLTKLPYLEDRFKVNFNVIGDKTYISTNKYQKTINLKFKDEHCTLVHNNQKTKVFLNGFQSKEQNLIMFEKQKDTFILYDGKTKTIVSNEEFKALDKLSNVYKENDSKRTLIEYYNEFMMKVNTLNEKTKGSINLRKCRYNPKIAVCKYFYDTSKGIEDPDDITELEEHWLAEFSGATMFAEKCKLENAYQYDINSAYLHFLSSNGFRIPVKEGTFKQIKELPEILEYGLYRVKINKHKYCKFNRLFRFRKDNIYTHFDIKSARELKLEMELIIDDESNALIYGAGTCINGCKMNKTMITKLFELKKEKVPFVKDMMILLWGSLAQKQTVKHMVINDDLKIPDGSIIHTMYPVKDGTYVKYYEFGNIFKYNHARFAPFLTSAVRHKLVCDVLPNIEHVHRIYTDSILSDIPLDNLKIGTEIGKYKLEKSGECYIDQTNMKPIWKT